MAMRVAQKTTNWLSLTSLVNLTNSSGTSLVSVPADFRGFNMRNSSTTANAWIQIFNGPASGVTLGTTEPVLSFLIAPGLERTINTSDIPLASFGSGMSYAATTAQANSTVASDAVIGRIFYWDSPQS